MSELYGDYNPKLTELNIGNVFDYNLKSWIVEEVYIYDWGNNFKSIEYKIFSGDEEAYLEVEDDDKINIIFSKDINLFDIHPNVKRSIFQEGNPPKQIAYNNKEFVFSEKFKAKARNKEDKEWEGFVLWDFWNAEKKNYVSVEKWGSDIEACFGWKVERNEISNILPADKNRVRARKIRKLYGTGSYKSSNRDFKNEMGMKSIRIFVAFLFIFIFFIVMADGCGSGSNGVFIYGGSGRYGGGSSWSGGGGGGSWGGGGGGFGK